MRPPGILFFRILLLRFAQLCICVSGVPVSGQVSAVRLRRAEVRAFVNEIKKCWGHVLPGQLGGVKRCVYIYIYICLSLSVYIYRII